MPEVIFTGPAGRIEGRYHPARQKNAPIGIVLHPHPQFGGTMNHAIVYQIYYAFVHRGFSALRFNFRGVGRSQGGFDHGIGELSDAAAALDAIRKAGARPGITLNPETEVSRLAPYLGQADLVLVMSVHPGFGGQPFIESALDKVRALRATLDAVGSAAELEVDGGIKPENARAVANAGASVLVAGSAVFLDPDGVTAALAKFRKASPSPRRPGRAQRAARR